jgi:adenylate cyclase
LASVYVLPDQRLIECRPGQSVLDSALRAGIAYAHACGGRAACSTCRMVVVEGDEACGPRTTREQLIAERLSFGPGFRLACQARITGNITIRRLVLTDEDVALADARRDDARPRSQGRVRSAFGRLGRRRARPRPVGDERDVAVLFADIRGFTPFAEALLPYDVIHVLELYLRDMATAVERQGGTVSSYTGDGVMAVFGATDARHRASLAAVRAGLDMLEMADARRAVLEEMHGRALDVNVGIHRGPAIVGALCGIPSPLTALGDTVNVASRIETANKEHGTRLLVSETVTADLAGHVDVGRIASCRLPGKAGEHVLTEVLGLR